MAGTISLVSFVRNEETNIESCFKPIVPYVEEVILFDLCSDDNTFDECKKITNNVYRKPALLCGDAYKIELAYLAKSDWLLWVYPDERFNEKTLQALKKLITSELISFTAFAFMRHEYIDGVRCQFMENGTIRYHGTPEHQNYQIRLVKNDKKIQYTELVHAELMGEYKTCGLPPELYFEHRKTSTDQEFDNIRTYVWMRQLIWKYGNVKIEPYKTFVDSYRKIVHDSQQRNIVGDRKIHLSEEFWYDYDKYLGMGRITKDEFKQLMGIDYEIMVGGGKC